MKRNLRKNTRSGVHPTQPFHWFAEFYEIIHGNGGFDVIIGNPPYVEEKKISYKLPEKYRVSGNLYAYVMEVSKTINSTYGNIGMIVPLSGHSTKRMKSLVENFYTKASTTHIYNLSCDAHPSILFPGVRFRLAIFFTTNSFSNAKTTQLYTTKYKKWFAEEREYLFLNIRYQNCNIDLNEIIPKICDSTHMKIFNKLSSANTTHLLSKGNKIAYYHNTPVSWIRCHSFIPYFRSERDGEKQSTQLKPLCFDNEISSTNIVGILSSSLFFLNWITLSDCYHLNNPEVLGFKYPIGWNENHDLLLASKNLEQDIKAKSKRREYNYKTSGRVEYDEYYVKLSKPIIDEIDKILARHYGFTEEELDFIINYDIKYRMGKALFGEDEAGDG